MKKLLVSLGAVALVALPASAAFATPEIGPCSDPNAVVVRVGQAAKVCVAP